MNIKPRAPVRNHIVSLYPCRCHLKKNEKEKRQTLHTKIFLKYLHWRFPVSTGEYSLITTVSHVLLVSGSVIMFTGLLGCLGSVQEIRWLVFMHMGFLILIIIIQAAVIVLLYTGKDMINLHWKAKMDQLISNYGNKHLIDTEQWNILDVFQRMLHCCGQHNFTDWKVNEHKEHVDQIPCSCTTLNTMKWFCDPVQDAIYTRGCAKDIRIWYEENIWLLISINTGLLLVEIFQLVAAASLFTIMRKNVILPTN